VGLRRVVAGQLPDYMVPAAVMVLDALPLTPNGKLDRRALPAPSVRAEEYAAPRTPAEEQIAAICEEVLQVGRIGINSPLFDLGMHSLLATQVHSRIQNAFHVEFPLRSIFDTPSVAGLALAVVQAQAELVDSDELLAILEELE
jgi:acyl carrier protein